MVISVPSTGTRFLAKLLGQDVYWHTYLFNDPAEVERRSDGVIAAPLRRPEAAWRTWWQRFNDRTNPEWRERMNDRHPHSLEAAWRSLGVLAEQLDICFVPIDVLNRDEYLAFLSERVGRELVTDWTPVGERPAAEKKDEPPLKNWGWVYEMPFMRKIYADL